MAFPFLHTRGVLGLNARNLLYVKPFNPKKAVAFADDKLKTKAFLSARGIPTAKVYGRIDSRRQLASFDFNTLPDECVLKPNFGYGGEGIIILRGRRNGLFLEQGKAPIPRTQLRDHIEDIIDGKFSVNGRTDSAFFERILEADECFASLRPAGLPDIRIIVFNLVPVMAMLRIPTAESNGKANVHLGGIGIGIDLAKGETTYGAQYNNILSVLPHGVPVAGMHIPQWEKLLLIASRIQYMTNIGYLAVDLTIDKETGPVLLEVNARAGLMVQVANLAPLRSRLERVGGLDVPSPEKGVLLAQELFGRKATERKSTALDQKTIIGLNEVIHITGDGIELEEPAQICPEQEVTTFSRELIDVLLKKKLAERVPSRVQSFRVKFTIGGKKLQTIVRSEQHEGVRVRIGSRDLPEFLIDPSKKTGGRKVMQGRLRIDFRLLDSQLAAIDRRLPLLKYLRPVNLQEEMLRAQHDTLYNPIFHYCAAPDDLDEIENTLRRTESDDSPLGALLRKKCKELLLRIDILRSRNNSRLYTTACEALYGKADDRLCTAARSYIDHLEQTTDDESEESLMKAAAVREQFEEVLRKYGLHEWQVILKKSMVADCSIGRKKVFLREGAMLSQSRVASLIAHEIETHALCSENAHMQPYELLQVGLAGYLVTQEGLAIINQERVLPRRHTKRHLHAQLILATAYAAQHSFAETRRWMQEALGMSEGLAMRKAVTLKRGIIDTSEHGTCSRSTVYFRGRQIIESFLQAGGNIRHLYIGRINIEDLETVLGLPDVKPALILPSWVSGKNA